MNSDATLNLILDALTEYGSNLLYILGSLVLVLGVGFLIYKVGWGYIRNMPGDWTYNSQRSSYRLGGGRNVKVKSGNLLG